MSKSGPKSAGERAHDLVPFFTACDGEPNACKEFDFKDGFYRSRPFRMAKYWNVELLSFSNPDEAEAALRRYEATGRTLPVRGALKVGAGSRRVQRCKLPKKGTNPTVQATKRNFLMIDIDKVLVPGIDVLKDPEGAVRAIVRLMIPRIQRATIIFQFSGSAGLRKTSDEKGAPYVLDGAAPLSLHLIVFLDREVSDKEARDWMTAVNQKVGYKLMDPALCEAIQPHFIANPKFHGCEDHIPVRIGRIEGDPVVVTEPEGSPFILPLDVPAEAHLASGSPLLKAKGGRPKGSKDKEQRKSRSSRKAAKDAKIIEASRDASALSLVSAPTRLPKGVQGWLSRIGEDAFRSVILSAVASRIGVGDIVDANGFDVTELIEAVRTAAAGKDLGYRSADDIARVLSDRHIREMVKALLEAQTETEKQGTRDLRCGTALTHIPGVTLSERIEQHLDTSTNADKKASLQFWITKTLDAMWRDAANLAAGDLNSAPTIFANRSTCGMGKTVDVVNAIGSDPRSRRAARLASNLPGWKVEGPIVIVAPNHTIGGQYVKLFAAYPLLKVVEWKGKGAAGCNRREDLDEVYDANMGTKGMCNGCPFADTCGFMAQQKAAKNADVLITVKDFVVGEFALPEGMNNPALVILDEGFADKATKKQSIGMDVLLSPRAGYPEPRERVLSLIIDTARARGDIAGAILKAGMKDDLAQLHRRLQAECNPPVHPEMTLAEIKALTARVKEGDKHLEAALIAFVMGEIEQAEAGNYALRPYVQKRPYKTGCRREMVEWYERHDHFRWAACPMMVVDANAKASRIEAMFPGRRVEVSGERAHLNLHAVQIMDRTMSTASLTADDADGRALIEQCRSLIERLVKRHGSLLVVLPLGAEALLKAGWTVPERVYIHHYGAIRGLDDEDLKRCAAALLIGRNQPSEIENAAQTEALHRCHVPLEGKKGYYPKVPTPHNMKGGVVATHLVPGLRNGLAKDNLAESRENEIAQALHRLRLVWRKEKAHAYIATNIALQEIEIDAITTWEAMCEGTDESLLNRLGRTLATHGVLPINQGLLHALNSDEFDSEDAAGYALRSCRLSAIAMTVRPDRIPSDLADKVLVSVRVKKARNAGTVVVVVEPSRLKGPASVETLVPLLARVLGAVGVDVIRVESILSAPAANVTVKVVETAAEAAIAAALNATDLVGEEAAPALVAAASAAEVVAAPAPANEQALDEGNLDRLVLASLSQTSEVGTGNDTALTNRQRTVADAARYVATQEMVGRRRAAVRRAG